MSRRLWPGIAAVAACLALVPAASLAADLYVDDTPGCGGNAPCYGTIGAAVAAASPGDTIHVLAGTYIEPAVMIAKTLTISGAGKVTTTVLPPGIGFYIDADGVVLENMTIRGGSFAVRFEPPPAAVVNATIRNVEFDTNLTRGIEIHNNSMLNNLLVEGCDFYRIGTAIRMASSAKADGIEIRNSHFDTHTLGFYQANDGGSGWVKNLWVHDNVFHNIDFAAVYGEELYDVIVENNTFDLCARGFYLFKAYTAAGVPTGNLTIQNNSFLDGASAAVLLWASSDGLAGYGAKILNNTFALDVAYLDGEWGTIDIRMSADYVDAPIVIDGNSITFTGAYAGPTANYGIKMRGSPDDVTISYNTLDGGGVADGGGIPPLSGIYLQTNENAYFGPLQPDAVIRVTCNDIVNFVNGISVYDPVNAAWGGVPAGATVEVRYNNIYGNSGYGIESGPMGAVAAYENWWGAADGPSGVGPGMGDAITDYVDYDPWLTSIIGEVCPPPPCPDVMDPASQGYWHRQCLGVPASEGGIDPGRNGRGPSAPTEPMFVEELMGCADDRLEEMGYFYALTTCDGMDADPPSDICEKAIKQLTALILNVCSYRLGDGCEVDVAGWGCSSTSIGGLIDEIGALISMDQCHMANGCAAAVNEGYGLDYPGPAPAEESDGHAPEATRPSDRTPGQQQGKSLGR